MLLQELRRLEPDAQQVSLGSHKVWMWQTVVPAFTFNNILLLASDERAIEIKARTGFSTELAKGLLDVVVRWEGFEAQAKTITVLPWPRSLR